MGKRRGRNEGTIAQQPDGHWHAKFSIGGGKRKSLYAKTKQEVQRKVDVLKSKLLTGDAPKVDRSSLSEYLVSWLDAIQVRPKTLAQYTGIVKTHIEPAIGH